MHQQQQQQRQRGLHAPSTAPRPAPPRPFLKGSIAYLQPSRCCGTVGERPPLSGAVAASMRSHKYSEYRSQVLLLYPNARRTGRHGRTAGRAIRRVAGTARGKSSRYLSRVEPNHEWTWQVMRVVLTRVSICIHHACIACVRSCGQAQPAHS